MAVQPAAPAAGAVLLSVTLKPVTPTLSPAVKLLIGTVREVAVAGIEKPVTDGTVVSGTGLFTVTATALEVATLFDAS